MEQNAINNEFSKQNLENTRTYQGETLNAFAKMEQSNLKRG